MSCLTAAFLLALPLANLPSKPVVTDLRCEYQREPLSIECLAPRLSWVTQCEAQSWRQSAYQILVASDPKRLKPAEADLWDSGRVQSDQSLLVSYSGKRLSSRQTCFWKVRVWDATGKASAWSAPAKWEMGLLSATDWSSSQWIGIDFPTAGPNPAPHLRKTFSVGGAVKRARLYASGVGYAEFHLNGKRVAPNTEREPGYTNFDKRLLYVAYDVTRALKQGPNAIGAVLGTGWYDVHDQATWQFHHAPWRGRPRMRAVLVVQYADGQTEQVVSDGSWRAATGPILVDGIYSGEIYDARKELGAWTTPNYDDSTWKPVAVLPAPKGKLAARQCAPIQIIETIKAKKIYEPKPGVFVLDFGQNLAGHVRFRVKANAGHEITLNYSERMKPNGEIERGQIECFMDKQPVQRFQTDTYRCKGSGTETWEQRFSYSGFQYVEVVGYPGKPKLEDFEARLACTHFEDRGEFACSNELLNKIQHATRYAYLSNAQSIPTDCPQREKNGWTGDAHLAAEAGLMNFCSGAFYTKWLDDVADDQQPEGNLSVIIPTGGWGRGDCHPSWDSAFAIIADTMNRYEDDSQLLVKHYEGLKRYVDFLYAKTRLDLIPFDSLGDWLPWKTETSSKLTSTVMLFSDAKIVAKAASLAGKPVEAEKYLALAEKVKKAYVKHYLSSDEINKGTQTALAIAIYFGLAEGDTRKAAFDALVKDIERQGHIDTGIIGAKYALRVLSENGRTDLAYRLVSRKEQPGWGWWIEQGATTLWEDWKGESSLNHIMFGDVSNWMIQWLAGIGLDPQANAFKHILIQPQVVGDLTWAKASVLSPYGRIASSWKRNGKRLHLEVEIPANTTATVRLPGKSEAFEVGSGRHAFDADL